MDTVAQTGVFPAAGTAYGKQAHGCKRLTTTLYELIAALQDEVGAEEDELVVTLVDHWQQSGRLTVLRGRSLAGCPLGVGASCNSAGTRPGCSLALACGYDRIVRNNPGAENVSPLLG